MPLASSSVTLAGQPSKVGGTVARVFGWIALVVGWIVALSFAGLSLAVSSMWPVLIAGLPIAVIASLVAWALLRSGKQLQKSGDDTELATKNQAIFALANTRGGVVTAWDVAQMLHLTPKEGDDILTKLAKEYPDYVTVDIDDHGNVLYRVIPTAWRSVAAASGMAPNAPPGHVRVGAQPRVAETAGASVRVDARDPLEDEFEESDRARQKAR